MKYGTYPATIGLLDWLSHRLDAVDFSTFEYWFERRKLVSLYDDVCEGRISRRAACRVLQAYNRETDQNLSLDEIEELDDRYVFSPAGDWIVYSDDVQSLLKSVKEDDSENAVDSLAKGEGARWVVIFTGEGSVHALKTPYIERRELNRSADNFAHALKPGDQETYVLPPEVHGLIKQEREMR